SAPALRRLPGVAHGEPPVDRDLSLLRRGRDLAERRPAPAARGPGPPSDDVTVAFDPHGRGYLCASRASNTPAGRAMFAWRTVDGGRGFSAPVALVPQGVPELDHPGIAVGAGQTPSQRNVYVTWAGGADDLHKNNLAFTHSTDGGKSFEPPRTIDPEPL